MVKLPILFLNQAHAGLWPAHTWLLEIDPVCEVCVCVSVFTTKATNN